MYAQLQTVLSTLVAQTATSSPKSGCGGESSSLVMIVVMFAIFYFIVIAPQSKERKRHQKMMSELIRGDDVVTQTGLFGKITDIAPKTLTLEVARGVKIKVLKSTVAQKVDMAKVDGEGSAEAKS